MRKTILFFGSFALFSVIVFIAACGSGPGNNPSGKPVASGPAGNSLTATVASADGTFKKGQ